MSNKNFAVFNALNLINKKLGTSYEENGFNPFSENYDLSATGVESLLKINQRKKFIESPKFLEECESALVKKLELAQKRSEEFLQQFQDLLAKGNASPKMLEEFIYLKICTELLKNINLKNLNYEEILDVIQTIYAMSAQYSVVFKRVFDKDFDVQLAITDFVRLCKITKTKKEIDKQSDLRTLVHREFTQKNIFDKPKKSKEKDHEIGK